MSFAEHQDIRIGTLAPMDKGADYLRQVVKHGFESFQLTLWQYVGDVDLQRLAVDTKSALGANAVVSSLGIYGNPLQDERCAEDWRKVIKACRSFSCDVVCGFAGAIEEKPVDESMQQYKKVFGELARVAEGEGVRIAFENCDMGGTWQSPRWNIAHSPAAWNLMFDAVPSDSIGLEWEPCHQMVSLIDPIAQLREWVHKVFHVHGKDATIAWDVLKRDGLRSGRQWVWHRTPGFGDTNWADVISVLRQGGFRGAIDIEGWHDPVYRDELEMTGQVRALEYLKTCRGSRFVANPV